MLTGLDMRVPDTGHHGVSGRHTVGCVTSTTYAINIASTGHHGASGPHTMRRITSTTYAINMAEKPW